LKFADDTKIWGTVDSKMERENMQQDMDTLSEWAKRNLMPFNVDKCKVMHIGKKNPKEKYRLMDKFIPVAREEKIWG